MEINMKDKLRTLRHQKNVTQEALAMHLGITPQSVGKWERGEGFPDITLLPHIAFYFDITVDELLNVGQVRVEEKISEYKCQSLIYKNSGETRKNFELWESAYKQFPNDCRVIEELMLATFSDWNFDPAHLHVHRIISLGKALMQKSTDDRQRENAISCLCYTYNKIGDKDSALYYADMSGGFGATREELRATILEGEEGVRACQSYIMSLIHTAAMTAANMTTKIKFSPAEKIAVYQFAIDIIERLFADGNVGFYAYDLSYYYREIASEFADMADVQGTLRALGESERYAIIDAQLCDMKYTAPMVNRINHVNSDISKNYKGNSCNLRLEGLKDKKYDFVRDSEEFKNITSSLENYAE